MNNSHSFNCDPIRQRLLTSAFLVGLATQTSWAGSISYNFSENPGNQVLDNVTPKGPLNTTFWNDSNLEGAPSSGTEAALLDGTGTPTTASITWSSTNTWYGGSGTDSENAKLLVGYLDDGGSGVAVTLNNIPYAKYNVYGLLASDQGGEYTSQDFQVNGQWAFPALQLDNAGSTGNAGDTLVNTGTQELAGALAGSSDPAFSFNNQSASVPYNAAFNPASFTVDCWIKPTNLAAGNRVLVQSMINGQNPSNADDRSGWVFRQEGDKLTFVVGGTGPLGGSVFYTTIATTAAPVLTAGIWQHVAVSYDSGPKNISIYVNGVEVLDATATAPLIPNFAAPVILGNRGFGGWGYVGSMDEAAIYPGVLPQATLAAHHANGIDSGRATPYSTLVQASSPLGYWTGARFQGTTAGTASAYGDWLTAQQVWVRVDPVTNQRGNYFRVKGVTGSTCTIQGLARSGNNRASLAGLIIEESLTPSSFVNVGIESFESADLASGQTSVFRPGLDVATVTSNNGLSVAATHSITITPSPSLVTGNYPLIDYAGTIGGSGFGGFALTPSSNPRYGLSLVNNVATTSVDLAYTAPGAIVWTAGFDTNWGNTTDPNWKLESNASPTQFYPFDVVKFDNNASSGTVTLSTPVSPVSILVNNSSLPYSFSGEAITGTASLTKTGAGSLSLANSNTFTGPVSLLGGTVDIAAGNSLGTGNASPTTLSNVTLLPTANMTLARKMTVSGAAEVEVGAGLQFIAPGGFNGGGTLTKSGDGELRFDSYGGGGFNGNIVVEAGSLVMAGGVFNADLGIDAITVKSGASLIEPAGAYHAMGGYAAPTPVLNLEEGSTFIIDQENYFETLNLTGATLVGASEVRTDNNFVANILSSSVNTLWTARVNSVLSAMTFNVEDGPLPIDFTMSGLLTNTQAFVKNGAGTMELTALNTYSGNTTINAGTLMLSGAGGIYESPFVEVKTGAALDATPLGFPLAVPQLQTLKGGGTVKGDLELIGTVEPGSSSGKLTVDGAVQIDSYSQYVWEVSDWSAGAVAGTGYDTIVADSVDIIADSGNPVYITIKPDALAGFTEANRTFTLIQTTGGITGFSAGAFDIDASALNAVVTPYGTWSVAVQGNNLVLIYTAGTPSPFQAWVSGPPYNLTGLDVLPGADPDKDGISNAIEFVLGGNPATGNDNAKLPTGAVVGANFQFTFRRTDLSNYAPVPFAEFSSTLSGWSPAPGVVVTNDFYGPGIDRVVASIPMTGQKMFVRLNANP